MLEGHSTVRDILSYGRILGSAERRWDHANLAEMVRVFPGTASFFCDWHEASHALVCQFFLFGGVAMEST